MPYPCNFRHLSHLYLGRKGTLENYVPCAMFAFCVYRMGFALLGVDITYLGRRRLDSLLITENLDVDYDYLVVVGSREVFIVVVVGVVGIV